MMLSTASESVLRTKACKVSHSWQLDIKIDFSTPECLAGPVQETQRGSEGHGPGTQPPGLQGGGGLGETLPVPGGRGPRPPLPAREQGGAGREHRGEIPQVRCLSGS